MRPATRLAGCGLPASADVQATTLLLVHSPLQIIASVCPELHGLFTVKLATLLMVRAL